MENVVLIVHLLLALTLIGVVLLQRSEGGGLGMGSGGGGAMTGRSAASALAKVTWILAIGFIITSMTLTIIAAQKSAGSSVIDRLGGSGTVEQQDEQSLPDIDDLLPPSANDAAPLVPRAD
jgi:preprotein translocase subunit SecG